MRIEPINDPIKTNDKQIIPPKNIDQMMVGVSQMVHVKT